MLVYVPKRYTKLQNLSVSLFLSLSLSLSVSLSLSLSLFLSLSLSLPGRQAPALYELMAPSPSGIYQEDYPPLLLPLHTDYHHTVLSSQASGVKHSHFHPCPLFIGYRPCVFVYFLCHTSMDIEACWGYEELVTISSGQRLDTRTVYTRLITSRRKSHCTHYDYMPYTLIVVGLVS